MEFNPDIHYIGRFCPRHEHGKTGSTVRYIKTRRCVACNIENSVRYQKRSDYKEKRKPRDKKWERKNPEKRKKYWTAYNKRHRERNNKEYREACQKLTDRYVRDRLRAVGIKDITKEMIEAKRYQLQLHRLLSEAKNTLNRESEMAKKIKYAENWGKEVERLIKGGSNENSSRGNK